MKIRVLHVIDSFDLGGGQTALLNLLHALDRDRFEPEVACMEEAANGKLDVPVEKELAESFSRGTRAVIGAAVRVPSVGCDVISGWKRIDVGP